MVDSEVSSGPARPAAIAPAPDSSPSSGEARNDIELVRRCLEGDTGAFDEIILRHHQRIFGIAFSVLRSRTDAEEIVQDTFVRAHRALPRFRGDSALVTWLHRIALNLTHNRYWHNFRRCQHLTRSLDAPLRGDGSASLAGLIACEAPGPVRSAVVREFSDLVEGCMTQLGAAHREIIHQRNQQNRSYQEIARVQGISVGTVKSRLARARASLRLLLAREFPEEAPDAPPEAWFEPIRTSEGLAVPCL